jgi:integrase
VARPAGPERNRRRVDPQPAPGASGGRDPDCPVGVGHHERRRRGPAGQEEAGAPGALGEDEVRRVLAAAETLAHSLQVEPAAPVALRLAAITGARRSELAALRWVDLDGDRLSIDSSVAIIRHGKPEERKKPTLRDDPTKTANRRTVTLDATTAEALTRLKRLQQNLGPWILNIGERPVNPERIGAWWRRARDRARMDGRWRLHDLRHWSATMSNSRGHDIRTVLNRLGHANPAMTLRVYAHAVESADGAVAVLDAPPHRRVSDPVRHFEDRPWRHAAAVRRGERGRVPCQVRSYSSLTITLPIAVTEVLASMARFKRPMRSMSTFPECRKR